MNKKFTISLIVSLVFASQGFASEQKLQLPNLIESLEGKATMNGVTLKKPSRGESGKRGMQRECPVTPVITEVTGTTKEYIKYSIGTYVFEEVEVYEDNFGSQIVFGENNDVYFYNLFSKRPLNSYVKGTLDGNKITVELPQTIAYYDNFHYGIDVVVLKGEFYEANGDTYVEYYWDDTITSVTYTIAGDGTITLDPIGSGFDGYYLPEYTLGLVTTDDEAWMGYADFVQTYTPDNQKANQIPDGVTTEQYSFTYGTEGNLINVAIDGDKVYFQGMSELLPDGVVIGTLDSNNIVTITQNQNTGRLSSYNIYTKVVYVNPDFVEGDPAHPYYILAPEDVTYKLTYDPKTKTFSAVDKDVYFCLNGLLDSIMYLGLYQDIFMTPFSGYNGTPANPYGLQFNEESVSRYGYFSFYFYAPVYTSDKTLLQQDDLYFRIYVDGELMEFEETFGTDLLGYQDYLYAGIESPTTEIPVDFDNQWDIVVWSDGMHEIGLYKEGIETVGVDVVYKYGGNTTYSQTMTLDVATGNITSGIENLGSEAAPQTVEYFNLNGTKVTNPEKGIYVKRVVLSDGKVKTSKVAR